MLYKIFIKFSGNVEVRVAGNNWTYIHNLQRESMNSTAQITFFPQAIPTSIFTS